MCQPKGTLYANSEYEGLEEGQRDWIEKSRGKLVQDEVIAGGRGCMLRVLTAIITIAPFILRVICILKEY